MNWKKHLFVGMGFLVLATIIYVVLNKYDIILTFDYFVLVIGWIVGLYCSLLPDIDIRTSKVFGFTLFISLCAIVYFIVSNGYIEIICIVIFLLFTLSLSHRGIMHKWYTSIFIGVIVVFIFTSAIVGVFAALGYISHAGIEHSDK